MIPGIEFYLQEYGVTNLIDIDDLLYAPVSDLWRFYRDYTIDRFLDAALLLAAVVIVILLIRILAGIFVRFIENRTQTDSMKHCVDHMQQ